MRRKNLNSWMALGMDSWRLAFESASVIGLRMTKLAAGGAAGDAEATRMVAEKVAAAQELQVKAMTGALGTTPLTVARSSVAQLRRKVRANQRRLGKR